MSIETQIDIVVKNLNRLKDVSASLQSIQKSNKDLVKGLGRVEEKLASINSVGFKGAEKGLDNMRKKVDSIGKGSSVSKLSSGFATIRKNAVQAAESINKGFKTTAILAIAGGLLKAGAAGGAFGTAMAGVSQQMIISTAAMAGFGPQIVSAFGLAASAVKKTTAGLFKLGGVVRTVDQNVATTILGVTGGLKAINTGLQSMQIKTLDAVNSFRNMLDGAGLRELRGYVRAARTEMEGFQASTVGAGQAALKLVAAMRAMDKEKLAVDDLMYKAKGQATTSEQAENRAALQQFKEKYLLQKEIVELKAQEAALGFEARRREKKELKQMADIGIRARKRAAQKRKDIKARFNENLMLGAGFPLLFGGGAGAVAGGIGGAYAQKGGKGFGMQILFSALGQQVDRFVSETVQSVTKLGQAFTSVGGSFDMMTERSLFSSDATRLQAESLMKQGKQAQAAALMTKELTKVLGADALGKLKELGEKSKELAKKWGVLKTQMELLIVGPLTKMVDMLSKIVGRQTAKNQLRNTIEQTKSMGLSSRPALMDAINEEIGKLPAIQRLDRLVDSEQVGGVGGVNVSNLSTEAITRLTEVLEKYNQSILQNVRPGSKLLQAKEGITPSSGEKYQSHQRVEDLIIAQEKLNKRSELELQLSNAITAEAKDELRVKIALLEVEGKIDAAQRERLKGAIQTGEEFKKHKVTTEDIKEQLATGMQSAIEGLIDGTKSLGESLAGIAKSIGSMFLQAGIRNMFNLSSSAEGSYNTAGGFRAFAQGGVTTGPTLGLIGEAGEPEYVIPASKMEGAMERYSAGSRGQGVIPGSGTVASGSGVAGGSVQIDYTGPILSFNSEDYLPRSAVPEIINSAARRGAEAGQSKVFNQLKNSRSQRSRIGL